MNYSTHGLFTIIHFCVNVLVGPNDSLLPTLSFVFSLFSFLHLPTSKIQSREEPTDYHINSCRGLSNQPCCPLSLTGCTIMLCWVEQQRGEGEAHGSSCSRGMSPSCGERRRSYLFRYVQERWLWCDIQYKIHIVARTQETWTGHWGLGSDCTKLRLSWYEIYW